MNTSGGKRLNQYVKDYTVFDLETTGLNPETDEIIEISALRVRSGNVIEEFTALVNPGRPIPYSATRINGITDQMVENAPSLRQTLPDFLAFIGKDILVGHNIHSFDLNFLRNGARRTTKQHIENDYVDTLSLAKICLPQLHRHRLTDLAAYFHIAAAGAHRALNDCVMNQLCYEKLGTLLEQAAENTASGQALPTCPRCGNVLIKRNGKFGAFWGCSGFPSCRYTQNA